MEPELQADPAGIKRRSAEKPNQSDPADRPAKKAKKRAAAERDFSRKLQIGDFEVRVNPAGTRMNITHSETLEQASMNIPQMEISFEGADIEIDSDRHAFISEWDLLLDVSSATSGKVVLRMSDGLEMAVPVAV